MNFIGILLILFLSIYLSICLFACIGPIITHSNGITTHFSPKQFEDNYDSKIHGNITYNGGS